MSVIIPANFFPGSPPLVLPLSETWVNKPVRQGLLFTHPADNMGLDLGITINAVDFLPQDPNYVTSLANNPSQQQLVKESFLNYIEASFPEMVKDNAYVTHRFSETQSHTIDSPIGDLHILNKIAIIEDSGTSLPYALTITGIAPRLEDDSIVTLTTIVQKIDFS